MAVYLFIWCLLDILYVCVCLHIPALYIYYVARVCPFIYNLVNIHRCEFDKSCCAFLYRCQYLHGNIALTLFRYCSLPVSGDDGGAAPIRYDIHTICMPISIFPACSFPHVVFHSHSSLAKVPFSMVCRCSAASIRLSSIHCVVQDSNFNSIFEQTD